MKAVHVNGMYEEQPSPGLQQGHVELEDSPTSKRLSYGMWLLSARNNSGLCFKDTYLLKTILISFFKTASG